MEQYKQFDTSNSLFFEEDGLHTQTLSDIYDNVYPPKTPVIESLLYTWMYFFAGAPKVGKSFFVAQLGYHVSMGIPLWNYPVHQGKVLYLALEDDFGRIQQRLSRMFGFETNADFHFATFSKSLNEGLEGQLKVFMMKPQGIRLIIIDTFQKIRDASGERYSYSGDYDIVSRLKACADRYRICLLVVHHTRKMEASDSMDMISGSTGLLGAADGAFTLIKDKRTENTALLEVVGRDQQDQKLHLNFNRSSTTWEFIKAETELWKPPRDEVIEALSGILLPSKPIWSGTATELLELLPKVSMQPNVLTRKLNANVERLLTDYNITYEAKRNSSGRQIILQLGSPSTTENDDIDGNDDVIDISSI